METNSFPCYSTEDLHNILKRTRDVSEDPYKLFVAFIMDSFNMILMPDDEDDLDMYDGVIGTPISEDVYRDTMKDGISDFMEAVNNSLPIEIEQRSYTIRHSNKIKLENLKNAFVPIKKNGALIITKKSIKNVSCLEKEQIKPLLEQTRENRIFMKKMVALAETGIDKLTPMENAFYQWVLHYSEMLDSPEMPPENKLFDLWYKKYGTDIELTSEEIKKCITDKTLTIEQYGKQCIFSKTKILEWNARNGYKSKVEAVDAEYAEKYWVKYH